MSRHEADPRAHLALDWVAKHGPVSGPLAMATTSMAVASTGALAGMPSGWPLAVGVVGAAAHGVGAGIRRRLTRPSLVTRAAGWLLSSGWTSAVIASDPTTWTGSQMWTALGVLAAITLGVGGAAYAADVHEEAADDARRALQAALTEAEVNRADWETVDRWLELVRQVTRIPVTYGGGFTRRPNGSGFALEIALPVGITSARFSAYATALAEAARLPQGCLVTISRARRQGHLILDVDTQDMSAVTTDYPVHDAAVPLTVNGPLPWVLDRNGEPVAVHMREACALIVGPPGTGKTTLLDSIIATFARCTDVILYGIDVGKSGDAFVPWVLPWLEARGEARVPDGAVRPPKDTTPVFDWVAATMAEAELMLDALLAIGERRLNAYRSLMRERDTKVLPVSHEVPMIFCIIDEGAEMLAYQGRDPLRNRVKQKIIQVMRTLRAMGIRLILTATDGNVSSIGDSAVRKYSPVRVALTATDPEGASVAKLFGQVRGIDPTQLRAKGTGVIGASTGDDNAISPTPMRTYLTKPSLARDMCIRTRAIRPTKLDDASIEAAGDAYKSRWDPKRINWLIAPAPQGEVNETEMPGGAQTPAVSRSPRTTFRRTLDLPSRKLSPEEEAQRQREKEMQNREGSGPVTDEELAKFLGALEKLPEVEEPTRESDQGQEDGPAWLPRAIAAIRDRGPDGMKVGEVADLVGLDRKTVRLALRTREELVYRSNGPHSAYVHRDHA